ncbi:MAG: hypothetical protein NC399_02910 [Muribaculum sp.]|nr:hypothetical protein [Muribaculum sp.]
MSEMEKEIIRKIALIIPKLDDNKQNYILGVAEGMVLAKETMGAGLNDRGHDV